MNTGMRIPPMIELAITVVIILLLWATSPARHDDDDDFPGGMA